MTIDRLAAMTQHEFRQADQRADRLEQRMDQGFKAVVDVLDVMRSDLQDIKIAIGPLVRTVAELETTVRHLDKRVSRLETKASFAK